MDADSIRIRIRQRRAQGQLPWPTTMRRLVAQLGRGDVCLVCDDPIGSEAMEYVYSDDGERHLHRECFVLWMEALEREARSPEPPRRRPSGGERP